MAYFESYKIFRILMISSSVFNKNKARIPVEASWANCIFLISWFRL